MKIIIFFLTILSFFSISAQKAKNLSPIPLIFDTDIGPDYDDVGALTMLHAYADSGKVQILATIASNQYPRIAAVLDVINTYFGRPDIPIGVPKVKGVNIGVAQKWDSVLVAKYSHDLQVNDQAPDAVVLYRKILSEQADKSVTIVTVGFLTNLANLLDSQPDNFSALTGKELVRKKVKNLICMAGRFPDGKEFNVEMDAKASQKVVENWTTPIVFSGFEIGSKIFTGLPLIKSEVKNSPVKDVFAISIPLSQEDKNGRMSWDQTAVLVAVNGWSNYFSVKSGTFICKPDGSNSWSLKGNKHAYLVEKMPPKMIENIINNLMLYQPAKK